MISDHELETMCPNCVTPWKCNGPHEIEKTAFHKRMASINNECCTQDRPHTTNDRLSVGPHWSSVQVYQP